VRDQIHCTDVISAIEQYVESPAPGAVYNLGGCKENSASILEIIDILREEHNLDLIYSLSDKNRTGDHICYYTDMSKFKTNYLGWKIKVSLRDIIAEMIEVEKKK